MDKKYKKKYKRLEERYENLNEHMLDITDDNERYPNELRYLEAFIEWRNLNEESCILRITHMKSMTKIYHSQD